MTEWKPEPYRSSDKRRRIAARGVETDIIIDYDDVNHDQVDEDIEKIARILSDHWDDPDYETLLTPEQAAANGIAARIERLKGDLVIAGDRRDSEWCDRIEEELERLHELQNTYASNSGGSK